MSDELHVRVKEVFLSALGKTEGERPAFLHEACAGDEELMREVESLLLHHAEDEASRPTLDRKRVPSSTLPPQLRMPSPEAPTPISGTMTTRTTGRFEPGDVFAQRYRIVALLGMGGMGEVYRADDQVLGVPVALKLITGSGREQMERLLTEARLAREVTHENVCRVYDVGQVGQEYYLTMEHVDGEDLSSLLRRIGHFPSEKLLDLAHQLCSGVAAAHARGVLHHDLKPANILIDRDGRVKITDFGIAARSHRGPQLMGTPAYMAPERLAGREGTVRSDLYALGLVLYELASGSQVFTARTPRDYAELHQRVLPERLSERLGDVNPRLEAAIMRCLEKDPRDRPGSALELAAALPGGDALRMAIEVGDTPSPELVADARTPAAGIHPPLAAALLAGLLVGLLAVVALADRTFRSAEPGLIKPPRVLAERAREILRDLGHDLEAKDRAWGFMPTDIGFEGEAAHLFWYRQSSFWPLVPVDAGRMSADEHRADFYDPPATTYDEGMAQMVLDSGGRLIMFYLLPPTYVEDLPPALDVEDAYAAALESAGFDRSALRDAEPRKVPPVYADGRAAWTGADPRGGEAEVKIDAARQGGRVVYFSAWPEGDEEQAAGFFERLWGLSLMGQGGIVLLALTAVLLARANLRRGRGDLRSARALVSAVVAVKVISWLLAGDHALDLEIELTNFHVVLGIALVEALLVWLAYVALEPTVRRLWPHSLVSWNRLLRGRLRDPLIGRSLLVGAAAGTAWTVARQLDRLAAGALGLVIDPDLDTVAQLEVALNGRMPFSNLLIQGLYAVYAAVLGLFLLTVLRLVWRRPRWAIVSYVLVGAAFEAMAAGHLEVSWVLGLVVASTSAWLLVRFGLLTYATALLSYYVLLSSPITADFSAWFAGAGLFGLVVPALLGAFGCWTALAGRPLSSGWLDSEPAVLKT